MERASVRAWMVIQEPFITVSVANCEGRREKRGGGMRREGSVRSKGRREEREGARRETGKEPGRRKNKRCGVSNELLCVYSVSPIPMYCGEVCTRGVATGIL